MKTDELKTMVNALNELSESYADLMQTMKGTVKEVKTTKQLWRDKNKSKLIKLGLALIVFPEPTPISETIGTVLVAAGTVQQGIRNRAIYVDDVPKAFQKTLKEIRDLKFNV
ncbi:MAG: hypothetical protein QHH17_04445 [Candidatus Bathyarchaeota archaeon]|jgi:methyl-accepting chemotaxis protein|nr:hypothetical protein [Candidatus Bathyarchaeota archaeon]